MILSTSEFDFEIQHVPGSKNIVADFGSRYISESEYPVDSNLKEDFVFTWIHEQTIYPVPSIAIQHLCTEDNEQLSSYSTEEKNGRLVYSIQNKPFIYVPIKSQRAFFWSFHFPRHFGITKMIDTMKEAGYSWPQMEKKLQEYLTQCACAKQKHNASPKYKITKHRQSRKPMHIVCIDIYKYNDEHFFTAMDLYSKFSFCIIIVDETQSSIIDAFLEFTSLYGNPQILLHDNQFNFLPGVHSSTPSNHP